MKRALAIAVATASLVLGAAPAVAQSDDNRARIDEFDVPAGDESLQVEQLSPASARTRLPAQEVDRTLAAPPPATSGGPDQAQISATTDIRAPMQLSTHSDATDGDRAAVSSRGDSTPGPVVHLKGRDRCDPQQDRKKFAECLRILELRADEFHAPAPPQLSAEEKLLAEQRAADDRANRSPEHRLRLATMTEPDADLTSNQVIASIYLDSGTSPPEQQPETPSPENPSDPAAILKAIGLEMPSPPQN